MSQKSKLGAIFLLSIAEQIEGVQGNLPHSQGLEVVPVLCNMLSADCWSHGLLDLALCPLQYYNNQPDTVNQRRADAGSQWKI